VKKNRFVESQTTSHLLMIRPVHFKYNVQTAVNNAFMTKEPDQGAVQNRALEEFDGFVKKLQNAGVEVMVVNDTPEPNTPDSIFPNNWVSFHADGTLFLYPMYAPNRRLERKQSVLDMLAEKFEIKQQISFINREEKNQFLESTGSLVLDRENRIAYACISPRTDPDLLKDWCEVSHFKPVVFDAVDQHGMAIYHTNVLMAVADNYVVICLDAVSKTDEKEQLMASFEKTGKRVFQISFDQMNHFAGNMLQVENKSGEKILVMSQQAWQSLTTEQQEELQSYNEVLYSDIETIETNGGGSARCMLAAVHLPLKSVHQKGHL